MGRMDVLSFKCREIPEGRAMWTSKLGGHRAMGMAPENGTPGAILVANVPGKPGDSIDFDVLPIPTLGPNEFIGEVSWEEVPKRLAVPGDVVYVYVGPSVVCEPLDFVQHAMQWVNAYSSLFFMIFYWKLNVEDFLWMSVEIPVAGESSKRFASYRKIFMILTIVCWLIKIDPFYAQGLLYYIASDAKWYCIFALIYSVRAFIYTKENTPKARNLAENLFIVTDYLYPPDTAVDDPIHSNTWVIFFQVGSFAYSYSSLIQNFNDWNKGENVTMADAAPSVVLSAMMTIDVFIVRFAAQLSLVLLFLIFHFISRGITSLMICMLDLKKKLSRYHRDQIPTFSANSLQDLTFTELTIMFSALCWFMSSVRYFVAQFYRESVETRRRPPDIPAIFL